MIAFVSSGKLKFGIKKPNALFAKAEAAQALKATKARRERAAVDANDDDAEVDDAEVDESKMTAAEVAASQSARAEKKQRLERRRAEKPLHEMTRTAKQLWETARSSTGSGGSEAQSRAVAQLFELLRGQFAQLTSKHDTSRVIQTLLKFGDARMRTGVFDELRTQILDLCMSRYGRFLVVKMFKYCSAENRSAIFRAVYGHVARLARHKEGSKLIEFAYSVQANAMQRARMVEEFYGAEFAMLRRESDHTLAAFFEHAPEKRAGVLDYINGRMQMIFSKNGVDLTQSIVHHVLREYLLNAELAPARELIDLFAERIAEMLHTKNGALCAWLATSISTPKQRKHLVRSVKQYAKRVFMDEWGHVVAIRLLTCVDDTVQLRKMLVSEIIADLDALLLHRHGRRVILSMLRSPAAASTHDDAADGAAAVGLRELPAFETWPFTNVKQANKAGADPFVALLGSDIRPLFAKKVRVPADSTTDDKLVEVGKKDAIVRQSELLADLGEPLVQRLISKMQFVLRVYLCLAILEAALIVKPAGEEQHTALCVALVDTVLRDDPISVADVAALQGDEAPQQERVVVQAFSANLDDAAADNDGDDDDDDSGAAAAADGDAAAQKKKKTKTAVMSTASDVDGAGAENAPPILTLVTIGRLLKRLMRANVTCHHNGKEVTLGELVHALTAGQFAAFAERDGAAFVVLTMLVNASPAFRQVLVRDLKKAKLDDKLNGVKQLKLELAKK
jgi:hypothetical protein